MKKHLIIILAVSFIATSLLAKEPKRPDSYNYQRGWNALIDENYEEALSYFTKEINDNSKNGYAYACLAAIYLEYEEYGRAINNINNAIKYIPKKDGTYASWAYKMRGDICLELNDTVGALADYSMAIKVNSNDKNDANYNRRADLYAEMGEYELSNKDFDAMIKLQPGNALPYLGKGRNYRDMKDYDEALRLFTYAISLESNNDIAYAFRSECYLLKKEYNKAIKDAIKAIELSNNKKAALLLYDIADSTYMDVKVQLDIMQKKYPNEARWSLLNAYMAEGVGKYNEAIDYYKKANQIDYNSDVSYYISKDYVRLGDYEQALKYINESMQVDSVSYSNITVRADIYQKMGYIDLAIADNNKAVELYPEYAGPYSSRGWNNEFGGYIESAIEDYTIALSIIEKYPYAYLRRGVCYLRNGQNELAKRDLNKVIELADPLEELSLILFAYAWLKDDANFDIVMAMYLQTDEGKEDWYDIACMYSILGRKEIALEFLDTALEKDKKMTLYHLMNDYDLDNIRGTQKFEELIKKYGLKEYSLALENSEVIEKEAIILGSIDEIPFTKKGGVYEVKCSINELPLSFIFDTGASAVSISALEASFMLKNGYLSTKDFVGNQRFTDANGDISEGTIINLKSVKFGNSELTNVKASVVHNQKAPLLLGQTVLSRLGKIEIDYNQSKLKITR